jgi:propanol-preferring alcohol dehydrogenase
VDGPVTGDATLSPALIPELPVTMRAVRLLARQSAPELVEVPVPQPGPGEVLLAVEAAGLCHSDLHVIDAPAGALPFGPPFTLGHEVVGRVVLAGAGVAPGWTGRRVVVHGVWSCGTCRNCLLRRENYCLRLTGPVGCGLGRDGGLAEYMLVDDVRRLVPAEDLDPVTTAPLTDAGLTVYHALSGPPRVPDDGVAVVIGIGGLGHLAVQMLRATTGLRVVAVDVREPARRLATRLGADAVAPTPGEAAAAVATFSDGCGADLVLDLVGSSETLRAGGELLAGGAVMTIVGSAGGVLPIGKSTGLARGWTVRAPFWGPRDDLPAVLDLARAGSIAVSAEVVGLDDAVAAYELLRHGGVEGRVVVVPSHRASPARVGAGSEDRGRSEPEGTRR